MTDTLEIFGDEYTGVAGFKAKDDNGNIKTYIRPQGTKSISANGIGIDVTEYASVDVSVSPSLESKSVTITPTESSQSQTISPTSPTYDGLSSVSITVNPISSTYVGSGITRRSSSDLTASGATVSVPAGYYENAVSKSVASGTEGTPVATKGTVSNHSISITPSVTNTAGYISGGSHSGTPVSVSASELVSGNLSIGSNGTNIDVTNYATVSVSVSPTLRSVTKSYTPTESSQSETITPGTGYDGLSSVEITVNPISSTYVGSGITRRSSSDLTASGATVSVPSGYYETSASKSVASGSMGTPTATKGNVSNHSISVTPSVTNTAGYIAGGTVNGTAVSVSAAELVSGSETKTQNGTYDVTNLAEIVVDVQGGGGMKVKTTTATPDTASHIQFPVDGVPQVIALISPVDIPVGQTDIIATFVLDPDNSLHTQYICDTANSNVTYSSGVITPSYQNGYVHLSASGVEFANTSYKIIYAYDGSVSNYGFQNVQVGSGATSITFTGLPDEPDFFVCHFKSDFGTSSGYQRTIAVVYDGNSTYGLAMDSEANALGSWSYTYSNGTLTISSQGTNNGGYFHQPGYYQLTYGYGGTVEPVEIDVQPLSVTQNGTYTAPSGTAYSPVTVNVSGGGDWEVDTKTITASNYPVSISFSSMKGQPKAFFLKSTSQISSSGSTTYYYIIDMRYNGTNTTGSCFRIGSTRRVDPVTSGYSWSYSGTTLTITSSASSRSASPGAFYTTYELVYFY